MFGFDDTDLTEITVLLDRSGSMHLVHGETVEGFAAFVEKQKQVDGSCRLTLNQFDTQYQTVYRNRLLRRVPQLKLVPRGGTALFDAMGRCITENAARLERIAQSSRAQRTIMVIITDGQENSSCEYSRERVFSMVRHFTVNDDWQFVYLGANQDAIHEAAQMGIDCGAAMTYAGNSMGTRNAWQATGEAVARHRAGAEKRVAGSYFTESERDRARG